MPGELILGNTGEAHFYDDAYRWAKKAGISDDPEADMEQNCSRTAFITYIWKYAGSPSVPGEYAPAVNWAVSVGLMDTVMETDILRKDAVTLLYRYFA